MTIDMDKSTAHYSSIAVVDAVPVPNRSPMPQRVEVVAPADLQPGYQLTIDFNGSLLVVAVPEGGVKEGQTFLGNVVSEGDPTSCASGAGHRIPFGKWRDGLFNCFGNGCCHPFCCLAWWCTPCALGQVMTRMKLNGLGHRTSSDAYWTAFKVLFLTSVVYMAINESLSILVDPYVQIEVDDEGNIYNPYGEIPVWALVILAFRGAVRFLFFCYILYVTIRTRQEIRRRYAIPEKSCQGCEDCCCAFWCGCCTVMQMGRHTADYEMYHAACCTETGLPETAPLVV